MDSAINAYQDLLSELERLGPPRQGFVRIFRGETGFHKPTLPSGLRPGMPIWNRMIWNSYTLNLASDLKMSAQRSPLSNDDDFEIIEIVAFWAHAIAQHYGPNSNFLDVTHSLDIALWFALHHAEKVQLTQVIGPPGPSNPERDINLTENWIRYRPRTEAPGVLYIFDVPEWDGARTPPHGNLLDLAKAPAIFASSERIKVQAACLLAADPDIDGGDLSGFWRCDPIPVRWPMADAPRIHATTEEMFPNPSVDQWYKRFLSIPLIVQADASTQHLVMARPLPITQYLPNRIERVGETARYTTQINPVLVHTSVSSSLSATIPDARVQRDVTEHARDATPIVLESPLMLSSTSIGSGLWNHGLLGGDESDNIDAHDLQDGKPCGSVSLQNVFLEFSPLEQAGWERMEDTDTELALVRALWIVRRQLHYVIHLVYQKLPSAEMFIAGPIAYSFDTDIRRFRRWSPKDKNWLKLDAKTVGAKEFFIALTILRALSPIVKSDPVPIVVADSNDHLAMVVSVRATAARLMRVAAMSTGRDWYVLRDAVSNQPFFFSPATSLGTISIESSVPWSEVNALDIRRAIESQRW